MPRRGILRGWLLGLLGSVSVIATPVRTSEGTEFWVCFQRNHEESGADTLTLMLFLTSQWEATVRIQLRGLGLDTLVRLQPRQVLPFLVPSQAELKTGGKPEFLAIHIRADTPIAVYGLNRRRQSTDTYMGLPVPVLGTEYRIMTYRRLSSSFLPQVALIAVEDSTDVLIEPPGMSANDMAIPLEPVRYEAFLTRPLRLRLHRGQVYQLFGPPVGEPSDLTGTRIRASRPVAVFSGHVCAYIPLTVPACNHLVEQIPPVHAWGRHYYAGKFRWRSRYVVRVLAHYPNTQLFLNDRPIRKLEAGEFWEQTLTENVQITADKPILVAQFSEGYQNGDSIGDPMMLLLTPTQQFLSHYRLATPVQGMWRHFLNLVVPMSVVSSLRFNGAPVRAAFERVGSSQYAIATIEIPYGSHTLEADQPFGVYAYGFGYGADSYDAYGNPVGQAFHDVERQQDVLPPLADISQQLGTLRVFIRDDRPADRGLQEVRVLRSENLRGALPLVTPGMLRLEGEFAPIEANRSGYAVLAATDVAGNRSVVTLCYAYDMREERFTFVLCEGDQPNCAPVQRLWFIGAYAQLSNVQHRASVPRIGNLPTMYGVFRDATGWGGLGGIVGGGRLSPRWGVLARLGLETYGGTLSAPDTLLQRVRQPDGTVVPFQEEHRLQLRAPYAAIGVGIMWYPLARVYVTAELQGHLRLSRSITLQRSIVQPAGYVYSHTQTPVFEEAVDGFSALRLLFGSGAVSVGVHYPLLPEWHFVAELFHARGLTGLVKGGSWRIDQLGLRLGMLYRSWR